jgi:hypothetical protein
MDRADGFRVRSDLRSSEARRSDPKEGSGSAAAYRAADRTGPQVVADYRKRPSRSSHRSRPVLVDAVSWTLPIDLSVLWLQSEPKATPRT